MPVNCMCLIVLKRNLISSEGGRHPCLKGGGAGEEALSYSFYFLLVSECTYLLCLLVCFDLFYFVLFFLWLS